MDYYKDINAREILYETTLSDSNTSAQKRNIFDTEPLEKEGICWAGTGFLQPRFRPFQSPQHHEGRRNHHFS